MKDLDRPSPVCRDREGEADAAYHVSSTRRLLMLEKCETIHLWWQQTATYTIGRFGRGAAGINAYVLDVMEALQDVYVNHRDEADTIAKSVDASAIEVIKKWLRTRYENRPGY